MMNHLDQWAAEFTRRILSVSRKSAEINLVAPYVEPWRCHVKKSASQFFLQYLTRVKPIVREWKWMLCDISLSFTGTLVIFDWIAKCFCVHLLKYIIKLYIAVLIVLLIKPTILYAVF